jgi:integrase
MSVTYLSLFKRSNNIWYIIYNEDGRQRWKSTGCNLKSDALKQLTEFKKFIQSKPKAKFLSEFKQEFLEYSKMNYAKPTVDIFVVGLRNLQLIAGDCLLTHITPRHVDMYKTERMKKVSPVTVNVELRSLRTLFNVALRWNLIENNPFSKMQLMRVPERPPIFFTKEDFQKLILIIKEDWLKEIVIFAVVTGMRRGEILNLRWQEIDLERRIIQVQSTPTFKTKQGKKRTVPLSQTAYQILISRQSHSTCEYVFSLYNHNILGNFMTKKYKDYVRMAGLDESLHFHSLRHTTEIYSHLAASELHSAVNKISLN